MDLREYAQAFDEVEREFEQSVAAFGVPFEAGESSPRAARARIAGACGFRCENGDASLVRGWISPACLACRTGERTATFFVDLRCTRQCYFCFNPNQDHYEHFRTHVRNIVVELEQAHAAGAAFDCLAITGGEPMLHTAEVVAFLRRVQELYPGVHTRLYTSGDLLDAEGLRALAAAGLTEIRFSTKPSDAGGGAKHVYELMAQAVAVIPDVMIEVPVIPGTLDEMKELLVHADVIGVRGVNLLEFCFPLHNAEEFCSRGLTLRKRPFTYLYNYWYGGGIPVAGSERDALALLEFAAREGLRLGVHYCSSDNKNTGQIFQQNKAFFADAALRDAHPWLHQDEGSRFLMCAKAFGSDVLPVCAWTEGAGVPHGVDAGVPSVALPLDAVTALRRACPAVELGISVNVAEQGEDGAVHVREVALDRLDGEALS